MPKKTDESTEPLTLRDAKGEPIGAEDLQLEDLGSVPKAEKPAPAAVEQPAPRRGARPSGLVEELPEGEKLRPDETVRVLVRKDVVRMVFGHNQVTMKAGKVYKMPRAMADHLHKAGYA